MFNYDDIGEKIKSWAKWIAIVEAVLSVIGGILVIVNEIDIIGADSWVFMGPVLMILGPISAWVCSWLLYGFGELVDSALLYQLNNKYTPVTASYNKKDNEAKNTPTRSKYAPKASNSKRCCVFCGKLLPAGNPICVHCAEKKEPTYLTKEKTTIPGFQQYKICPHCGEIVKSSTCYVCGKPNNLFD